MSTSNQSYKELAIPFFKEVLEFHNDTFDEEEFDRFLISAEILGRNALKILQKSKKLESRIISVLAANLTVERESKIARDWAVKKDWEIEYAFKVLKTFQKGILREE